MSRLPQPFINLAQAVSVLAFGDVEYADRNSRPEATMDAWVVLPYDDDKRWDEACRQLVALAVNGGWRLSGRRASAVGQSANPDREDVPLAYLAGLPRVHVDNWLYNDGILEAGCYSDVKLLTADFETAVKAEGPVVALTKWVHGYQADKGVLPPIPEVEAFAKARLGKSRAWVRGSLPQHLRRSRGGEGSTKKLLSIGNPP